MINIEGNCHDLTKTNKLLFIYIFFSRLDTQEKSVEKYHMTKCHRSQLHHK